MSRYIAQPGNIKYQVGKSINAIRHAIDVGDIIRTIHHLSLLRSLVAPVVDISDIKLPGSASLAREDVDDEELNPAIFQAFQQCLEGLETILIRLADVGIYAYKSSEPEDATDLAILEDEE